jgi:UDP-glucose 4-epimerase
LRAKRSLLSIANLGAAVESIIMVKEPLRRPLIVADPDPLTVPAMITAMRAGLGRRPGLIDVPETLLRFGFRLGGHLELYRRLAEPLAGDPAALLRMGWVPRIATSAALGAATRNYEA